MFRKLISFMRIMNSIIRFRQPTSRIALTSEHKGLKRLGKRSVIFPYTVIKGCVIIGDHCSIHEFCFLSGNITIGNAVRIANKVSIQAGNHGIARSALIKDQASISKPIIINDDVWIGTSAVILPGVQVGTGAVIGAGAVVTKDISPYSIVAGVPAREIGKRS